MKLFCHKSRSGKLTSRLLCKFLAAWGKRYFYRVALEDIPILHEVQKGYDSVCRPSEGLISTREERCFHFQNWIKRATREKPVEPRRQRAAHFANSRTPMAPVAAMPGEPAVEQEVGRQGPE
jgi:hypothetical protein